MMNKLGKKKGWLISIIVFLLALSIYLIVHFTLARTATESTTHIQTAASPATNTSATIAAGEWITYTIQAGDTLSSIFHKLNFATNKLMLLENHHLQHLKVLKVNTPLYFLVGNKKLLALKYNLNFLQVAEISFTQNDLDIKVLDKPMTSSLQFKSAIIEHSLRDAAYRAGLTSTMLAQLEHIFRGSINFAHDIHKGDQFAILYKEYYIDGKKYHPGNIIAAEFSTHKKKFKAVRFSYPKNHVGYYTLAGRAMQSLFLDYPVHFKYISGHFTYHRFDPYLHKWHTHLGVDFAADRGSAIRSIGNGRIAFIGHDGGYGNCIKINYGRHYEGLYGHMWHFAPNLHLHDYVHKGEIIGYVGSTGWSTGPHLHFSFFINGIPKNWLAFKPPHAESIPRSYLKTFKESANHLINTLSLYQHEQ